MQTNISLDITVYLAHIHECESNSKAYSEDQRWPRITAINCKAIIKDVNVKKEEGERALKNKAKTVKK